MPDTAQATREIMWNIQPAWLMYALATVAVVIMGWGLYQRIESWRRGKAADERLSDWGKRFLILLRELFLQRKVMNTALPGLFHSLIFYSFLVLFITTCVVALDYDFGTTFFRGPVYVVLSVGCEIGGALLVVGLLIAAFRRWFMKPANLKTRMADGWAMVFLAGIIATGFLVEAARIAVAGDPWAEISVVGNGISGMFGGMDEGTGRTTHATIWWLHALMAFGFIAAIPYTKFFHLIALPTRAFFSKLEPFGTLQRPDVLALFEAEDEDFDEENMEVGVAKVADLTWSHRLDLDACISCARCDDVCPARMAGTKEGQAFSPQDLIHSIRDMVRAKEAKGEDLEAAGATPIVGQALDEAFTWYCRTCAACMEVCPASITHVDLFVDIRRNEVMMEGRIPSEASRALRTLENKGNPFGTQADRTDWIESTGVRVVKPGESVDVLYWVGCATSFDPTKQPIAETLFEIMSRCGIDFGVLGKDEQCCGDPARVMGQEMLFQDIAGRTAEELNKREFKTLLVSCPHGYNTFKNEYPQFGGNYDVKHHSELLRELITGGKLGKLSPTLRRVTYHDPCYLGRYGRIFDEPREVLWSIPGGAVKEMAHSGTKGLCCGAGGGHYWMDLEENDRVNNIRVREADEAGADTIAVACPFCNQMLNDSLRILNLDETIEVRDIGRLVLESLPAKTEES